MVYTSMATRAARNGHLEFCQQTMARDLGMSRSWVNAGARELEQRGLILVERRFIGRLQRSSRYALLDGIRKTEAKGADSGGLGEDSPPPGGSYPDPVGETTSALLDTVVDHGAEHDGKGCQPTDGALQLADQLRRQRADTSHESQIHIPLSDRCQRADRSSNQDSARSAGIAPDWRPSVDDLAWARARNPLLDTDAFTETFVLTCRAKGYHYADPSAAWCLWIADPKSPLPLLKPAAQTNPSGDSDHVPDQSPDHETVHASDRDRLAWNPGSAGRKTFSPSPTGRSFDLAADNASRAHACLERLLGRRADAPSPGYSA
jgi:hypothetical protein